MVRHIGLLLGMLAIALPVCGQSFIVQNGQAAAEIVVSLSPTRSERLAARELQAILERISGAQLPIVETPSGDRPTLLIGDTPRTRELGLSGDDLHHGAFRLVSGDGYLAFLGRNTDFTPIEPYGRDHQDKERVLAEWDEITGETWGNPMLSMHRRYSPALDLWQMDERGSLNAVYHFLRQLGCRWYYPGEIGELLPELATIELPTIDETVTPDFPVRHFFMYYHEFFAARPGLPEAIEDLKWQLRLGLSPYQPVLGPGLGHGSMSVHSREEVKQAHPEFFALWGGKRSTEHLGNYGAACLSSQGFFEQNVRYVRALFDHYDVPMISVAPADGYTAICQCEGCTGKDSPERGWYGQLSDYVWDFTNRVAQEVYKTHPDKKITCIAYGSYLLPPEHIGELSPNIVVGFCYWRSQLAHEDQRQRIETLRKDWLKILPSQQLFVWDYHRYSMSGKAYEAVPVLFPHRLAEDLRAMKGISWGDYVEIYRNHRTHDLIGDVLASDHLNIYAHARLLWQADLDVDAMLSEYASRFYGPAAEQMRRFIDYAEANWPRSTSEPEVIDRLLTLIAEAEAAAPDDTVYAQRVAMWSEYMTRLDDLRQRLRKGRDDNPQYRLLVRQPGDFTLDGKLDDTFWEKVPAASLKRAQTGAEPHAATWFKASWIGDALHVAIHCQEPNMETLNSAARHHEDMNIWQGDSVELLIETQVHSYYQIAISPDAWITDLDRASGFNSVWSGSIRAAAHRGDDFWSLEIVIPAAGDMAAEVDPNNGVAGRQPSKSYPWYFNICRTRRGQNQSELSCFSPTGEANFHIPAQFAKFHNPY